MEHGKPMRSEPRSGDGGAGLPTQYRPVEHEEGVRRAWVEAGAFRAEPGRVVSGEARGYSVLIPPPNVTDRLHLGHALNNSLQDILVRAHRMMGFEAMWMPGTDHAGIATQAVVEKRLMKEEKKRRSDLGREAFIARVQAYKDEYEAAITGQLKAMGCSCDWDRQRFTMDGVCARAVHEAFFRLFRDGLIYRGKRLVNWDPVLQTAVADDECYEEEVDSFFFYLRYPVVHPHGPTTRGERLRGELPPADAVPVTWSELARRGYPGAEAHPDEEQAWVTVATTRPETYLGDTAVAVNPRDPRARALRGLSVELPIVGRVIPIIEDEYVVLPARMQEDPEAAARDPKAVYATGFLKVTPAHDPNDHEIYVRHREVMDVSQGRPGGALINIFAPDATISNAHGWLDIAHAHVFVGKKREDARKMVVKEFGDRGLLEESRPYRHSLKFSDRSKAVIEPYLSDQWYVRVTDDRMSGAALRAMGDEVEGTRQGVAAGENTLGFFPERYARTFRQWHENIRDWCISRQLWWGHRIPVWCRRGLDAGGRDAALRAAGEGEGVVVRSEEETDGAWSVYACVREPEGGGAAALEGAGFERDPDVLDTWFSSALWPLSTLGWPDPARAAKETGIGDFALMLRAFNPTSTLCTAREIITLWVSRMTMFNRYFLAEGWGRGSSADRASLERQGQGRGPVPFREVFIHSVIQDGEGRKMSKSLGNGVDPLDIIASHGTDAMRFTLALMTTPTQDVRMPVQKDPATGRNTSSRFDLGRNFCNKLWNATRFALLMLEGAKPAGRLEAPSLADRWMLSRLSRAVTECEGALATYSFSVYAQTIYDLMWRDLCDWYLEAIKPTVAGSAVQRAVLSHAVEVVVRLLHPVCPFITEVLWERLREVETDAIEGIELGASRRAGVLCLAGWPRVSGSLRDEGAEAGFERVRGLVTAIREVRATHQVPPKRKIGVHVPAALLAEFGKDAGLVEVLGLVGALVSTPAPAGSPLFRFEGHECAASNLADAVDSGAERERLSRQRAEQAKSVAALESRLSNPGYADRAPKHLVEQTRAQLEQAREDLAATEAALGRIEG